MALLIAMAGLGDAALVGPPRSQVFDPIPKRDFVEALVADIDGLIDTIDSDTRNVVLTLARTWNTLATGGDSLEGDGRGVDAATTRSRTSTGARTGSRYLRRRRH